MTIEQIALEAIPDLSKQCYACKQDNQKRRELLKKRIEDLINERDHQNIGTAGTIQPVEEV